MEKKQIGAKEEGKNPVLVTNLKCIKFTLYSNDDIQPPPQNINQNLKKICHIDKPTAFNTQRRHDQNKYCEEKY